MDVPIDEIVLNNVGSESNKGMMLADVMGTLTKAILLATLQKGGGLIPADIGDDLGKGLSGLTSLASQGVGAAGDLGKQITNIGVGSAAEVAKGLQGVGQG